MNNIYNEKDQPDWSTLSKKERRLLKRERKKLEKRRERRKRSRLKWIGLAVVLVSLGGGIFLSQYFNTKRYQDAPKIQVTPKTHNFGQIPASAGKVETAFAVKNTGVATLTLSGLETSCGCTIATLKIKGPDSNITESPEFGMHDNPTNWSANLEPNEEAELVVVFDPDFHQNTSGPVTRTVSIFSNDPGNKEETINISATVQR